MKRTVMKQQPTAQCTASTAKQAWKIRVLELIGPKMFPRDGPNVQAILRSTAVESALISGTPVQTRSCDDVTAACRENKLGSKES
jgi:hypothetical protein